MKKFLTIFMTAILALVSLTSCFGTSDKNNVSPPQSNQTNQTDQENGESIKYAKYSNILKTVLTNEYYKNLESMENSDPLKGKKRSSFNNPLFMAIPYGFLEKEGFDIEKIKSGELYSKADNYILDKCLYIQLRTEIKTYTFWEETSSYLANYLLKYNLTDEEIYELNLLYSSLSKSNKKTYLQAPLFIQELSYQKEPEIVSIAYITLDSIHAAEDRCNEKQYVLQNNRLTYLGTTPIDELYYEQQFQTHNIADAYYNPDAVNFKTRLYTISFEILGSDGTMKIDNRAVQINYNKSAMCFPDYLKEKTLASKKVIQLLSSYYCTFEDITNLNIEDIITE